MLREFSNNRKDDDRSARMEALKFMDLAKVDTSNLKKPTGFERLRLSRRGPQSPLSVSLRDDSPADASSDHLKASPKTLFQKPVQKFGRSGSLQSLRILRTKSISSKLKKSPTPEDLHSKRATFSSILKDSKFHQVKPQVGIKESKDVLPVEKLWLEKKRSPRMEVRGRICIFMPLSDLYEPNKGYLVNDTCYIEADVVVRNVTDKWPYDLKPERSALLDLRTKATLNEYDSPAECSSVTLKARPNIFIQVANATNDVVGDSFTYATVLTCEIGFEGRKSVAVGMNAMDLIQEKQGASGTNNKLQALKLTKEFTQQDMLMLIEQMRDNELKRIIKRVTVVYICGKEGKLHLRALLKRVFMPCDMYFRYTRHKGRTTDFKVLPMMLYQWHKKLLESHWAIRGAWTQRNRGVAKYHEKMLRGFSKNRKDDDRSARKDALKFMHLEKVDTTNLKKPTGFERLRLSRRGPQSPPSVSLRYDSPVDASSDHLKASPKTLF
ncbi:ATP-dependent helicase BRM [Tanacetum coccineum]|uniref:ATP-dependent helicase BRM n=1 Tax=Tanacetum coccineum TaxID=301880 RepID=A0ABQ4ZVU8_9ASTR